MLLFVLLLFMPCLYSALRYALIRVSSRYWVRYYCFAFVPLLLPCIVLYVVTLCVTCDFVVPYYAHALRCSACY